jgi:hypothetical protein
MAKQYVKVSSEYNDRSRIDFFRNFVEGKRVLHVGFVDYPKPRPEKSLHLLLSPFCQVLDGVDPNVDFADSLRVENGKFFKDWREIKDEYDVILVPEVIEHVDNAREFLEIFDNYTGILIITAPDAYLLHHHFVKTESDTFQEFVHSDHKCWYSPYTLMNTINTCSKTRKVQSLYWLSKQSICAVCY